MGSQVWDSPTQRRKSAIPESWAQTEPGEAGTEQRSAPCWKVGSGKDGQGACEGAATGTVCSTSLVSDLPITTHVLACSDVTKSQ